MTQRALLALAALLFAVNVKAEDQGAYVGISLGEASQDFTTEVGSFEGSDTSFKLLAGYQFNEHFAVEGGYADGGTQQDTVNGIDVKLASEGLFAAFLAKLPIGQVIAPYAKVGYVVYDSSTTLTAGNNTASESENDDNPIFGLGCEFRLGEHLRLRAEYEYVDVPDVDFDIVSVVATWQF